MTVYNQWKNRKISKDTAIADLVVCRDYMAIQVMQRINDLSMRENAYHERQESQRIQGMLRAAQKPFIEHPVVQQYVKSFDAECMGKTGRWKPCVFKGPTERGKTWFAMSLFPGKTLKVSCNGLPEGIIPCLKEFNRTVHRAIVFDEIRPDQILGNREFFQSGQWPVKLGQSNCAQHEYAVWVYGIAMLLCTNDLSLDPKSKTYESDLDWLEGNLIIVELQAKQKWYKD